MFKKLLVPLDGSSFAEQALKPAATLARALDAYVELVLVRKPMAFNEIVDAAWLRDPSEGERAYITAKAQELAREESIVVSGSAIRGLAAEAICEHAKAIGAELIVMTSHGRTGISRMWMGSVANEVIRESPVPVLVLRPEARRKHPFGRAGIRRILVTLDGSPLANAILDSATRLARGFGATLSLLRVVEPVALVFPRSSCPAARCRATRKKPRWCSNTRTKRWPRSRAGSRTRD